VILTPGISVGKNLPDRNGDPKSSKRKERTDEALADKLSPHDGRLSIARNFRKGSGKKRLRDSYKKNSTPEHQQRGKNQRGTFTGSKVDEGAGNDTKPSTP